MLNYIPTTVSLTRYQKQFGGAENAGLENAVSDVLQVHKEGLTYQICGTPADMLLYASSELGHRF